MKTVVSMISWLIGSLVNIILYIYVLNIVLNKRELMLNALSVLTISVVFLLALVFSWWLTPLFIILAIYWKIKEKGDKK